MLYKKQVKRALFVIIFLAVGIWFVLPPVYKSKHLNAEMLGVDGVVTYIEWQTNNHALPLFKVQGANGLEYSYNDGELDLKKGTVTVGDTLIKKSGSRYCSINNIEIKCVKEYVGLYDAIYKAVQREK